MFLVIFLQFIRLSFFMKILILALSGIGDALMFTPALQLMRKAMPDANIDALVMFRGVKDIYERNPDLDSVIHFDFMKEGIASSLKFLYGLRKKYDASINVYPSNRKEYNIINYILGAKRRAGIKYLRADRKNFGWLNNIRTAEDDKLHNVEENINLAGRLLNLEFREPPQLKLLFKVEDIRYAEEYISSLGIKEDEKIIGFHPGCATLKNHEKRRWEPEKFASLAVELLRSECSKVLVFGGPEESELKKLIVETAGNPSVIAVNTDNLAQTAALMKMCAVFVSNDSSLMHIAAALQLKTAAIIGPTNTVYIHPWKTEYRIASLQLDCSPCFIYSPRPLICFRSDVKFKCIKELEVDLVYRKVLELLG